MAPLSLKIVLDRGAVTRTILFDSTNTVSQAHHIIREKLPTGGDGKDYGLFLTSADNPNSGIWLEGYRPLEYYMLRDGDSLEYLSRSRNLRVRMLDGAVKTLQVDETKNIGDLMMIICEKIGLANHDEYGLCTEEVKTEEVKEKPATGTLTLTLKRKAQRERDAKMEELSKKLKTDDNVTWLDHHKTLREMGVEQNETLLLKRRLFYSDRNVDSRDPVQLNLLYVQTRNAILEGRHPVIEEQAAECKVRWVNIRDVHRRILRKAATEPRKSRPYKYENEMSFMKNFYRDVVFPQDSDSDHDNDTQDVKNEDTDLNDVGQTHYESDESEQPVKKKKRRAAKKKREDSEDYNKPENVQVFSEPIQPPDLDNSDPVDAFLLSIGATLKTFSPYHLNLAKTKIFAIVQEHDLEQIVQRERPEIQSNDIKVTVSGADPMYIH